MDFDALIKEVWEPSLQKELEKAIVAKEITQYTAEADGYDTINKPYISRHFAQSYTPGSSFTAQTKSSTNESLSINQIKVVPVSIDLVEFIQSGYSFEDELGKEFAIDLMRKMDADVLSEYDNATNDVDDGDIGGSSGTSITISETNCYKVFTAAQKKLIKENAYLAGSMFAVINPTFHEKLVNLGMLKDSNLGDMLWQNGRVGNVAGFDVYVSNNLSFTARWTPANNPTANDTISINGVTLTFVASTSAAGEVQIAGSTALTLDNLVTALNAPGTTTANVFTALSQDNQRLLEGIVATDGTTYLGIEHVGGGEVDVAGSDSNDVWSVQTVHNLFGQKGATRLAAQRTPRIGFNQIQDQLEGSGYLHAYDIYGFKTWARNLPKLVDVNISYS